MALNFADIATKKVEDVEKPPLAPVGTYRFVVTKVPAITTSADELWDMCTVTCRALEAEDDVDMEDYPGEVKSIVMQHTFVFNKSDEVEFAKTEYRLRQFLENHVKCTEPGTSFTQALNASVNGQFLGTVGWRPDKRNEGDFQAQISRTAPLD